jgi:hypothetical protein
MLSSHGLIIYRKEAALLIEGLHITVRMHKLGFGVEPRHKLPLFDGLDMLLTLDNYDLVRPDRVCESLDVGICN